MDTEEDARNKSTVKQWEEDEVIVVGDSKNLIEFHAQNCKLKEKTSCERNS
jgi:hypothetical protein